MIKSFLTYGAVFALAIVTLLPRPASAGKRSWRAPSRVTTPVGDSVLSKDPYQAEPADQVVARLGAIIKRNIKKPNRKGPNKAAHTLSLAFEALKARHFAEARTLAKTAQTDELFSDYSHWIQAISYIEEARKSAGTASTPAEKKQVASLSQQAYTHFLEVLTAGDPHSALVHLASKQVGIAELYWADALPPSRISLKHYQSAFQRLSVSHGAAEVSADQVSAFSGTCRKFQSALCEAWVIKLSTSLPKESDEYSEILKLFPEMQTLPKAPPGFSRATQTYKGADLDTVAFEDAMAALRGSNVVDGIAKIKSFLDDFPKSTFRFRARFFLAQTYLSKKQNDDAKRVFEGLEKESPLTYYGLLSALALGHPIDNSIDKSFPLAAQRDAFLLPDELFKLNRAEILISEGAGELASLELRGISIRAQLSGAFLTYLALLDHQAQDHSMVFQLLSELLQRGYPGLASQFGLSLIFPVEVTDPIRKYSKEYSVDPILIMSLIKQESAFDVKANSGSGASGLMQLMNFTALEILPGVTRDQLIEADTNVHAGTKYLSKLLDHYKGNIVLALAAYNAGPGAVDRWIREGIQEKRTMIDFVEAIPFKETREYVGSIIRNYYWYSKRVAHADQPVTLAYFWKPYRELNKEIGTPQPKSMPTPVVYTFPSSMPKADEETPDDDLEKVAAAMPSPSTSPSAAGAVVTISTGSPTPTPIPTPSSSSTLVASPAPSAPTPSATPTTTAPGVPINSEL